MNKHKNIIFIVASLIIIATLFIPPFYGKGDDGSFYSILLENGLYNAEGADTSFFNNIFGVSQTDTDGGFLPITVAKALCAFVSTVVIDIRVLGALYLPFYLLAMYLILRKIKIENKALEITVSIIAAIILCDIGYISYMNSLYKEALYLVFLMLFAGSALNIKKEDGICWPCAVALLFSAGVLAFMGIEGLLAGIALGAALIISNLCLKNISFQATLCGILAIVISAGCFFAAPAAGGSDAEIYSRVFDAVDVQNAEKELESLGISAKYKDFAGKSYYTVLEKNEGVLPPALLTELKEVSRGDMFSFYIKSPKNFINVLTLAGKNAPFLSQSYISTKMNTNYYIKSAPGIWSYARRFMTPGNIWIILLVSLAVIVCIFAFFKNDAEILAAGLPLAVLSPAFMVYPILKGGLLGISRNLILHQAAFDLIVIVAIICAVNFALERRKNIKEKFGVNQ